LALGLWGVIRMGVILLPLTVTLARLN
jgi:hypothetical protein